tara:strand:+ start:3346 stop:4362 length:1017 start_codon:yes stop_codon:yes gene_type:complete
MRVLITGVAGFIGFHLAKRLIMENQDVIGIDNINNYYDKSLKKARLKQLIKIKKDNYEFKEVDLCDKKSINLIFDKFKPQIVINLAAQAGVRYSIENPNAYLDSNLIGFMNIIENCRKIKPHHFIYASSSSVYGGNTNLPFSECDNVDHPVSLYAATKKANELIAHSYSHLFNIPSSGLRFFTVYGPWGRPDMALFLFTKAIIDGEPIKVFNQGEMIRDFTYIDDVVESLWRLMKKPPMRNDEINKNLINPSNSWAPHRVFNIGNSNPIPLMKFIEALEDNLGKKANKIYLPMQPGDVKATSADTTILEEWINFKPKTTVKDGISNFVQWYKDFYSIS